MTELVDSTKILVLASHERNLLTNNCNRVIWLDHGKVRMDSSPEEVLPAYFGSA